MVPPILNSHQCSIKTALNPRFLFQNTREETTKERYPHLTSVPKSLPVILFVILGQETVTELAKVSESHCRLTLKSRQFCPPSKTPKSIRSAQHLHGSLLTSTIKILQRNVRGIWLFAFSELGTSHWYWDESKRSQTPTSSSYLVKPSKSYRSAFSDHSQVDIERSHQQHASSPAPIYTYIGSPSSHRLTNEKPVQASPYVRLKPSI